MPLISKLETILFFFFFPDTFFCSKIGVGESLENSIGLSFQNLESFFRPSVFTDTFQITRGLLVGLLLYTDWLTDFWLDELWTKMLNVTRLVVLCQLIYRVVQTMAHFFYALSSSYIDQFSNYLRRENQENICNKTVTKDPNMYFKCVATLTCEM